MAAAALEFAERVDESRPQQAVEPGSFLVGETGVAAVGFGVGQVDLPMGDIKIATEHHRLRLLEIADEFKEGRVP